MSESKKAIYCSDNCRKYANKEKLDILKSPNNEIDYLVTFAGIKIKFEQKNTQLILQKLGVNNNVINRHNDSHKPITIIPNIIESKKEESDKFESIKMGIALSDEPPKIDIDSPMQIDEYIEDEKSYDYYYNKVAEYKQDQTITQYEREDLSKEITKCNNISKKQKETLIQSLKN